MEIEAGLTGSKILIVDDNPANLGVVADYLETYNFNIFTALDGQDALKIVKKLVPDLILLDVMMPGIDGFEVCRRLKANPSTQAIPVVFMTALTSEDDKVKGFEAGAVDYVTKPVQQREVMARVITHLQIQSQTRQLQAAYAEIQKLNARLQEENLRLEAELDVARRLQQMLLPGHEELRQIEELDIAGFMQPADEVGGDYYDVLRENGRIKIGIGDVTGHGLESGVVMLMVQMAMRTLLASGVHDPVRFMEVLNRALRANLQRMGVHKNLSLLVLDYERDKQQLHVSGQHEHVIILRAGGQLEVQDTQDLGFPVGLTEGIGQFVHQISIPLAPGDSVILYSDGVTEAENDAGEMYGLERLCAAARPHCAKSAEALKEAVTADVRQFVGAQKVYDDLALLVIQQKARA